ncbi:predicted protein [Aspergillus nidulans FGSC A4]|uniref:Uncharacterized protein n=1 Tax=Emericella nidulans (strain FGSC A4 / ATCC 38163 / CBS 112.46 / NRRL 194 / M139) TaxID=227321 RepID=Q5BC05_EMENI|nr:hypothetical protein [Aspergillus nidulans FGSC A4]EAA65090.1 predicted protein [Aspergillus nidulans FGSC A4]CBF85837.1 TPA: conserved hypothetical protein [Aspergillus nidulans FGSC A4]|eukprot:XP_659529.1 predicted protein [Aspergillus nidulans FGSC A4]
MTGSLGLFLLISRMRPWPSSLYGWRWCFEVNRFTVPPICAGCHVRVLLSTSSNGGLRQRACTIRSLASRTFRCHTDHLSAKERLAQMQAWSAWKTERTF